MTERQRHRDIFEQDTVENLLQIDSAQRHPARELLDTGTRHTLLPEPGGELILDGRGGRLQHPPLGIGQFLVGDAERHDSGLERFAQLGRFLSVAAQALLGAALDHLERIDPRLARTQRRAPQRQLDITGGQRQAIGNDFQATGHAPIVNGVELQIRSHRNVDVPTGGIGGVLERRNIVQIELHGLAGLAQTADQLQRQPRRVDFRGIRNRRRRRRLYLPGRHKGIEVGQNATDRSGSNLVVGLRADPIAPRQQMTQFAGTLVQFGCADIEVEPPVRTQHRRVRDNPDRPFNLLPRGTGQQLRQAGPGSPQCLYSDEKQHQAEHHPKVHGKIPPRGLRGARDQMVQCRPPAIRLRIRSRTA